MTILDCCISLKGKKKFGCMGVVDMHAPASVNWLLTYGLRCSLLPSIQLAN